MEQSPRLRVLVAGASGYLGKFVVREAKSRGMWVRALARSRAKVAEVADACDEVFVGEVTDSGSLQGCFEGIDVVFSSIGITRQTDKVTYEDVDLKGNLNLLEGAAAAGCKRFVYVSALHLELVAHIDMAAAKLRFEEELTKQHQVEWAVVRPTGFFCDMAEFLNMARNGRCYVIGNGKTKMNPIHGADLAVVCAEAMTGSPNQKIDVGGPRTFTWDEVCGTAFAALGQKRRITHVPVCMIRAVLPLVKLVNRRAWNLGSFALMSQRDLVGPPAGTHDLAEFFREQAFSQPA